MGGIIMVLSLLSSPQGVGLVSGLGGIPTGSIGAGGLVAIVIVAILMGKLVPRRTLEDTIVDRNDWRAAHKVSEEARVELQQQVSELLELSRTTATIIQAIPLGVLRSREKGDEDDVPH